MRRLCSLSLPWRDGASTSDMALSEEEGEERARGRRFLSRLPPFLIISAEQDLGLEADARRFVRLLERAQVPVDYIESIPETNHASVCWNRATHDACAEYIYRLERQN